MKDNSVGKQLVVSATCDNFLLKLGLKMNGTVNNVLVVGLGSIGRRHTRIIRKLYSDIKIIALRHKQCNDSDIETLGLYRCVTTIEDALAFRPEAAIVANLETY